MTSYFVSIADDSTGTSLAYAHGSLKLVTLAVNEGLAKVEDKDSAELNVSFYETNGIEGEAVGKSFVTVTDFDTVDAVLARKLKSLKATDPDVPARKPRKPRQAQTENTEGDSVPVAVEQDGTHSV
jgi:hypothetical protein